MLRLLRPTPDRIHRIVAGLRDAPFTYDCSGQTRQQSCPAGFTKNHCRIVVGTGEAVFERACNAFRNWQMLNLGWLQVVAAPEEIASGQLIAMLMRVCGCWSLNVARIVYVEDESPGRFAFGYGTLREYPIAGEERLSVRLDPATEQVIYEVDSFSRPASLAARVGGPLVRRIQRKFCHDSTAAMRLACRDEAT